MELEHFFIKTAINILVNFMKIIYSDKVLLNMLMAVGMKENGKMTNKVDLELKAGKMALILKDNFYMD